MGSRNDGRWTQTPFLEEHDVEKLLCTTCNYFALGQTELARALLRLLAKKNLKKAKRVLQTILWHGSPRHWLCSANTPSSAHLAWFCLIEFRQIFPRVQIPRWLSLRLEFDILIANSLLDGAANLGHNHLVLQDFGSVIISKVLGRAL